MAWLLKMSSIDLAIRLKHVCVRACARESVRECLCARTGVRRMFASKYISKSKNFK